MAYIGLALLAISIITSIITIIKLRKENQQLFEENQELIAENQRLLIEKATRPQWLIGKPIEPNQNSK